MKFTTNINAHEIERNFEFTVGESLTVPDMSYTVKELMEKFVVGNDPGIAQDAQYEENPDIDAEVQDTLQDLTEIDLHREKTETLRRKVDEINKKKQEKLNIQRKKDADDLEKYRKMQKAKQETQVPTDSKKSSTNQ